MKEYTQVEKMALCANCKAHKKVNQYAGEDYCNEVGERIAEIGGCRVWADYYEFMANFGAQDVACP